MVIEVVTPAVESSVNTGVGLGASDISFELLGTLGLKKPSIRMER